MIVTLWELVGSRIVAYLVCIIFWGITGYGSLIFHASVLHVTLEDLQHFLRRLRFPFDFLRKLYVGNIDEDSANILAMSSRDGMIFRVFGSIFPIIFICTLIYNIVIFPYAQEILAANLILTAAFIVTTAIAWQFGHSLGNQQSQPIKKFSKD